MNRQLIIQDSTQTKRQAESGVALLTVLALLSIFAVVLVGFTYTIRMEENTIKQYADSVNVQESTEAAIQGVLAQLARDLDPLKPNYVLGRPQPKYTSLLEPWAYGYSGWIGNNVAYDARSHILDVRPQSVFDRTGLRMLPTPIPRGVDEDPPGDVTGGRAVRGTNVQQRQQGDGASGLKGIDDDLDGNIDNCDPYDDDEDFRVDEDPLDKRRDGGYFTPGTGYDQDGDRLGVFDETAKINVNLAGNNFGQGNSHIYNLGVSPTELDLPVFLFQRIVQYGSASGIRTFSAADAEKVAQQIVSFRYGSVADGGNSSNVRPGVNNEDDNNNGSPGILQIETYSRAFSDLAKFDGEPFAIVGNQVDDDDDGLLNEEDEHYIGPSTDNPNGTSLSKPFDQDRVENFRPGDRIDNNGNGYIDEAREGTDDPSEFSVFKPKGDDRPFATVDDLKMVGPMRVADPSPKTFPTIYDILNQAATIYSQADEISGPLSARDNEVAKINPNLSSNWLAADIWNLSRPTANRADFQYSPKIRIEDMLALQVDNDGDWQAEDEVNMEDGIDNDGDGLIDESSDDWDKNHYPSGDFDGFGEADLGAPAFASGIDYDFDQQQRDKVKTGGREIIQGQIKLGWAEKDESGNTIKAANFDSTRQDWVTYDEKQTDILPGLVVEGNGMDDDGDLLIDDTGDFNGDGLLSYDPEAHVSEDAWGDMNGDGYPGLGADPEADQDSREGRIYQEPDNRDALLVTSLADDDYDGYADFYDPQVLAAMFAPEWDGVDNDNDGEVDEVGERYIACFDDDEDGRMDEDPPEFQIALNLLDYVDTWMPFPVSEDADVRRLLGKTLDDPVLADPVTFRTLNLYSSRQRSFRMHPRLLAGPNSTAKERQEFVEQMRLLLPNPPLTGYPVKFEGVEAIRINEVMAKPVIRLEAEEVLDMIQYDQTDPDNAYPYSISYKSSRFEVKGNTDDGRNPATGQYDTNWGTTAASADGAQAAASVPGFIFLPEGFKNTFHRFLPIVNMDSLAPAFIFSVTNIARPMQDSTSKVGLAPEEEGVWIFNNIPAGYYDPVVYMHPSHRYRTEVKYYFNRREISFKSDYAFGDNQEKTGPFLDELQAELIRRDTAVLPGSNNETFPLRYRLTPYPMADKYNMSPSQRVVVGTDGVLEVRIVASEPIGGLGSGDYYATSFDRIELVNPWVQYVELANLSTEDINLSGWSVSTPYGSYLIPEGTIIGRMKPGYKKDDGRDLPINQGLPGDGVPSEPLLQKEKLNDPGSSISSTELRLEDNKLLLANHKNALVKFIKDNYPDVPRIDERVIEPVLSPQESAMVQRSIATKTRPLGSEELRNSQQSDLRFRLVDMQEDVLANNPVDKLVTLSDPSGHYIDSFKYRTTFNNVIVDIPDNGAGWDLVALPGYRGMETFERADPTHFETKMVVDANSGNISGERSVPSSIKLDAKDAVLLNLDATKNFERVQIGGYVNPGQGTDNDKNGTSLKLPRFSDISSFPTNDSHWNGWDFIGDYYEYPKDNSDSRQAATYENSKIYAREAVAPSGAAKVSFYDMLGGFENASNVRNAQQIRYTAYVWRMGLRELIRAGYDPDVDDQLTVRVLGRTATNESGVFNNIDLPVGEVLVIPTVRVLDPGDKALDEKSQQLEANPYSIVVDAVRSNQVKRPIFSKLRNGDTAFTIDLRQRFSNLTTDLKANSESEPIVEIMIILRKSTPDLGTGTTANITETNRPDLDRPDLGVDLGGLTLTPNTKGNYHFGASYVGSLADDNYFFRGIELFGRGRKSNNDSEESNAQRVMLAGTPGRDNAGYVPAYPRRRLDLTGKQRDKLDVIDNTGYVKNGPLATVGELSRVFTGNRFETINTPLIPQRLEDIAAVISNRVYSNPELAQRARTTTEYRKALAQRERLDQWENQYMQMYNMMTTSDSGIRPGLININTAAREVLVALPFCPPLEPGKLQQLQVRSDFNTICADFILEGRSPTGFDMGFGIHNLDDDSYLTRVNKTMTAADTLTDFKLRSVGREYDAFKQLDKIESERWNQLNLTIQNVEENKSGNLRTKAYLSTEINEPDDGPYRDIGELLSQITHMRRRDRYAEMVRRRYDRTLDNIIDNPGDLRERINESTVGRSDPLTGEEMEAIMNRISNLITVRSRAFSIITRGRIFDSDGNITAQRKLETVYQR